MKKLLFLLCLTISTQSVAESNDLTLSQKLAVASFGNGDYPVGSIVEKRAASALDNVENLCSEGLKEPLLLSQIGHDLLAKEGFYVTPLEIIETIGTLKRQAPKDISCQDVLSNYISTVKVVPTPTEALASVNSLYKILKQKTK